MLSAVNISEHNCVIDFKALKANAVILRVGYRGYGLEGRIMLDRKFTTYVNAANSYDIPVGVYFASQALTTLEAKKEAQFVLKSIKKYKIDLPVYIAVDYIENEYGYVGRLYNARPSKEKLSNIVKTFCDTIEEQGYNAGVFANYDFFRNKLNIDKLKKYSLWLDYNSLTLPKVAGATFDMWQYRSDEKVEGILGDVSMSQILFNFCSTNFKKYKIFQVLTR